MTHERHIILFDGVCSFCNSAVQFVIKRDRHQLFRFASLQSEAGRALLSEMNLPDAHLKSFVYIRGKEGYIKSDAALKVAANLPFPASLVAGFSVVPRFVRDAVYDIIAKYRYRLFGKKATCEIPAPELRKRFLA